ncbi:hypothetical protein S7711_11302 [Stachybotrys chartarum IBT 7711]|uniref:Glutaminase n=1 Tax=Stachybotrys chartarum (strain CBS 109288 / IBT 7711) TaxID=1280523 RepID=A0A084AKF0_STACB|nr:hypothetical protein S7711_11302 [Stachybotrys chartarum IBT 7711]
MSWHKFIIAFAMAAYATASTLTPPVLPLIVRNPYLSTWLPSAREVPWQHWPMFWTGQEIGFSAMALLPGSHTVYPLLGRPHDSLPQSSNFTVSYPIYMGASFDASTTNLTYKLESEGASDSSVTLILSFVSPITPTSTFRQSFPAAYLVVHVQGHGKVDVYVDLNGQWVSGKRDSQIVWDLVELPGRDHSKASTKTWTVLRKTEQLLTETNDRAEWGTLRFTGPKHARHQCGTSAVLRRQFAEHGQLLDEVDGDFRQIMEDEPVFAFSTSFDLPNNTLDGTSEVPQERYSLYSIALTQDPVVQFASARGLTYMKPLWASYMPKAEDMISYHYEDYPDATQLARDYSDRLSKDSNASGSHQYQDIVALSARQVLGATQFSGTSENPIIFLKEISSNGNFQTVDVIFPAFPFFLYTNPRWLAYLLEPLLEHQLSGQYPNDYSMHDLGAHFPNATGHTDGKDEYMPVEECGNMLIMALALVNALGDDPQSTQKRHEQVQLSTTITGPISERAAHLSLSMDERGVDMPLRSEHNGLTVAQSWAARSYWLWKQWTGYLVRESLIPRNQLCTDDFAGWLANQTNLALKGIIAIRAMADISELVGEHNDARYFRNISTAYIEKWQSYGISRDGTHAKLSYTWYGSWTTIYNLFADALLCFHLPDGSRGVSGRSQKSLLKPAENFIPNKVYSMQSKWYKAVVQRYGLPLDSRHLYTKSDWQLFAAAVTSTTTRKSILDAMALWINETVTDRPFTDLYDTEGSGNFSPVKFMARPVVGGHFARLALEKACGGKAVEGLEFLDQEEDDSAVDVTQSLAADVGEKGSWSAGAEL